MGDRSEGIRVSSLFGDPSGGDSIDSVERRPIEEDTIRDSDGFTLSIVMICFLGAIGIVVDSPRAGLMSSEFETMGVGAAAFVNVGSTFETAGPFESHEAFPDSTKPAMILLRWMGRVEVIPVVLLTAAIW